MKQDAINKELQRIQDSAPKEIKDAILTVKKLTPEMEFIVERALESETISDEKKAELARFYEAGQFSKEEHVINPKAEKVYDDYIAREIKKSIKAGRLPTKKQLKELPFIKKLNKRYEDEKGKRPS